MFNMSKEEIREKMFYVREENSNQPIAVIKVADLMKAEITPGEWIDTGEKMENYGEWYRCSNCEHTDFYGNFCPNCGSSMKKEVVRNENNKEN